MPSLDDNFPNNCSKHSCLKALCCCSNNIFVRENNIPLPENISIIPNIWDHIDKIIPKRKNRYS